MDADGDPRTLRWWRCSRCFERSIALAVVCGPSIAEEARAKAAEYREILRDNPRMNRWEHHFTHDLYRAELAEDPQLVERLGPFIDNELRTRLAAEMDRLEGRSTT